MATLDLRSIAQKTTTLSELMEGREAIKTPDLIKTFPDGVHINACDIVETVDARYCTVTFSEDETKFYNGGLVLTKIVDAWVQAGETLENVNKELAKNPVKMRFTESKNKKGDKNVTLIEVL